MTKTAKEMIQYMDEMENGQRIEFLEYLFYAHFDKRSSKDKDLEMTLVSVRHHIEVSIEKILTEEELSIMKLAYDNGYYVGWREGIAKVLNRED